MLRNIIVDNIKLDFCIKIMSLELFVEQQQLWSCR